jgi:RimJ/RimL family protein N-acetyltransferase
MFKFATLFKSSNKFLITLKNLRKTAYHHYGQSPSSLLKFLYYSAIRVNTFYVYENDLSKELPPHNLGPGFKVMKPTIEELEKIRAEKVLPREFYYDKIYNVKTCYLAFRGDELAYIHWVFFKGDYSRFLVLDNEGVVELNYNTTIPKFRGDWLSAKMMAYISRDLKDLGYKKVMGVIHEFNYPSIKCIKQAGFREVGKIRSIGPFHKKLRV